MRRLAYVCADRGVQLGGRSGSSVHVREFVRALVGRGMEVTTFAASPPPSGEGEDFGSPVLDFSTDATLSELRLLIGKELRSDSRSLVRAAETYDLLLNQSLAESLQPRRGEIDVVYERYSLWSFAGLQFALRSGVPFFLEVNAPLAAQQQQYRDLDMIETARAIESYLFAKADLILVTSEALREYVHSRGASRRGVRVIPCGVSRQFLSNPVRVARGAGSEFVIGFVGSLKPWHGIELLLEAFRTLRETNSEYRLLVVGDGPLAPQVASFCSRHHLEGSVRLVGSVDHADVPRYLAEMDVGVAPYPDLPSFYFSPLKVWEYAAAGVPIVASESGELPRLFPHRTAALLHPPGKVGKIVKHIERIRRDPDLGRRLARRARAVAKRHSWDRLAARFVTLADRAIESKAAAARRVRRRRDPS